MNLNLVKITDTLGEVTGSEGKVVWQALTDDELDRLYVMMSDYSYIGRNFEVETLGDVQVPSLDKD